MADIFRGFSCIRFAGYLEVRVVPPTTRGTPICMGYLYLCEVPLIVQGTSICAGYPDCAGIIPLVDTWRFYCPSYFSLKHLSFSNSGSPSIKPIIMGK